MRNDVILDGWKIRAGSAAFADDFAESVFFAGNGRMGVRGYAAGEPEERPVQKGLFAAGIFAEIKPGLTDFVNLPTPVWHRLAVHGDTGVLQGKLERELDLSCGLLCLQYTLRFGAQTVRVREERFFPPEYPSCLAQRITLHAAQALEAELCVGIHTASCNCPVPDDQVKENHETVQLMREVSHELRENAVFYRCRAAATDILLSEAQRFALPAGWRQAPLYQEGQCCGLTLHGTLPADSDVSFESLCRVLTSRDRDPQLARQPEGLDFAALLAQTKESFAARWAQAGLTVEGDAQTQTALRYAVYELLANASPRDDSVSIGARGLTHTRYKGCYFWDTDLFMMPFYLLEEPQTAKSLEEYRLACLPQAKAHAARMNSAGARYPWMAAYDGTEQCESWDIGASELHITADVVFAMEQYAEISGDADFAARAGEAYIETARFWASRYSPDPETGGVNLLFCKGPDEYCGITSNNLYTNVLVRRNLALAVRAAEAAQKNPEQWARLRLSEKEIAGWKRLQNAIPLPRDPVTGHWRQDDTFHLLEPVDPGTLKTDDSASYHTVCFDRLQRYKVIKQADVLLLMSRLPEHFTAGEKRWAWEDFEPLCLHDSTLSFASHALFAAQNGIGAAAARYFEKALYLDLREIMGNTGKEGLHMANFGELWQAVVFGFAGLHFSAAGPALRPHLPAGWSRLSFRFFWHGQKYRADVTQTAASLQEER